MAANVNKVPHTATSGTQASGTKIRAYYEKKVDNTSEVGVERGVGSATATDGSDTTSYLKHLMVADMIDDSVTVTRYSVTNSAALALASRVASSKWLLIENEGPNSCYYGTGSGITTNGTMSTKGTTIRPGDVHILRWGARISLYAIKNSAATATLRIQEWL